MRKLLDRLLEEEKRGLGPGGKCKCPKCGYEEEHPTGSPCDETKCPKCGATMGRV